jgi:hypothetical protein
MVNVISDITNAENGVYILWGIAFLGLVLKMISNAYIKMFMRKTENMATTKKKKLMCMRQKYENRKSMGMTGSADSFVEKNIRSFRFMGVPFDALGRHVNIGVYATVIVTAGAFALYDPSWRGSPGMVTFLANSVIVCAFLMSLENIFLTRTKLEIMKANIRDYLDNMTLRGADNARQAVCEPAAEVIQMPEIFGAKSQANVKRRQDCACKSHDGGNRIRDENVLAEAELAASSADISSDISLDGFLKEFFS